MQTDIPRIIQGGMGVGVSGWQLARAVASEGQLGVVSGTALEVIFVRHLQTGDSGGHLRRALAQFPMREVAYKWLHRYFIPHGKAVSASFEYSPMATLPLSRDHEELLMLANFCEVFLAKEGHSGQVGINFLEKIQLPLLPSLYGAMLAQVDCVLIGAGIPMQVPGILDSLTLQKKVSYKLNVEDADPADDFRSSFDPQEYVLDGPQTFRRPKFLAIVSSATLATALLKRATGRIDGFVFECAVAGGHNAPPRGTLTLTESGEPLYGPRDAVDLSAVLKIGRPFWLAGGYGSPEKFKEALETGASGVQVGTAFAFCDESGIERSVKDVFLNDAVNRRAVVFTDPAASPTGFSFKVAKLAGSMSEAVLTAARPRLCDLGYLRRLFKRPDGLVGYRCSGEPVENFIKKGGNIEETIGKKCLCNGLIATIGLAQKRLSGYLERPLVTAGDELNSIVCFIKDRTRPSYKAADVIHALLGGISLSVA